MPSIRDLKGNIIEPESPGLSPMRAPAQAAPDPPVVLPAAARDAIKKIHERHEAEGPREARSASSEEPSPAVTLVARTAAPLTLAAPLPEDFEAGLKALEASVALLYEQARLCMDASVMMQGQMEALRARAHADAAKLARVNAALRALEG